MTPKKNSFNAEEIKKSKRIFKSATPKYTTDWYIKWVASLFVLSAMSFRGVSGYETYDLYLYDRYIPLVMGISFMEWTCVNHVEWCWVVIINP